MQIQPNTNTVDGAKNTHVLYLVQIKHSNISRKREGTLVIQEINHITFVVADLERTKVFFEHIFELHTGTLSQRLDCYSQEGVF